MKEKPHKERRELNSIRTILASIQEGVIILDGKNQFLIFNEIAENFFQVKRAEIHSLKISDKALPENLFFIRSFVDELLKIKDKDQCLIRTIRFKNKIFRIYLSFFQVNEKDNGICLIISDITKNVEREEKAEAIFSSVSDGLVVLDCLGKIIQINPPAIEMLGIDDVGYIGQQISSLDVDDKLKKILEIKPNIHPDQDADRQPVCIDEVSLDKPEKKVLKIFTTTVVDRANNTLGFIKTIHDITAQKEIDQMKNDFISTVSHELRTPLTAIKGFIDLILQGEAGEINETQHEFLDIAKQNTDRLVKLISDLLDISKIESGRIRLRKEPVYIDELIEKSVLSFSKQLEDKGFSLVLSLEKPLPIITGDFDRLSQVLFNLISNAIKYSKAPGKIEIKAYRRENSLIIEVSDSGIGISAEDQMKLFEKFFRADSSVTQEVGGAGLGLAITKSIIKMHGGNIWVDSVEGEGSTFSFTLPIAISEIPISEELVTAAMTKTGKKPKILIVDDEPDILKLLQINLARENYQVCSAQTGEEALEIASKEKPDLITLDILLGGMSGLEALRILKNSEETKNIPVILMSVFPNEERIEQLGVASFISKPINVEQLLTSVQDIISKKMEKPCRNIFMVDCKDEDSAKLDEIIGQIKGNAISIKSEEFMKKIKKGLSPCLVIWDISADTQNKLRHISDMRKNGTVSKIPFLFLFDSNLFQGTREIFDLSDLEEIENKEKIDRLSKMINDTLTMKEVDPNQ